MISKKTSTLPTDITEENIFSKPKCQAILSLIAYFQQNKQNIQRAHLIRALVKNTNPNSLQKDFVNDIDKKMNTSEEQGNNNQTITQKRYSDDKNSLEKGIIDRLQVIGKITPKIMFNTIANLDKTVQYLRKLGLITNQYIRGYPRIILTDKGLTLYYKYLINKIVDELIHDGSQLMSISEHILTSVVPKEKKKTMVFDLLPEFYNYD
jgi:hypothetical protein